MEATAAKMTAVRALKARMHKCRLWIVTTDTTCPQCWLLCNAKVSECRGRPRAGISGMLSAARRDRVEVAQCLSASISRVWFSSA
jgi:hypothetical protein